MLTCHVTLDPAFRIGTVNPRLFGSFVEHMGRCVYGGIFEPGHEEADADGLRQDVLKLSRELGVTVIRYPGGNFVSGYRWEDGVGPVEQRPRRLDLAWRSVETNAFGFNEFMTWARRAEVEPMMAVNLGTRGIQEACDLLEYANHPGGTYWSDLRVSHGVAEPYGIKLWCLGNEMDGPWQVGHKSADAYGALAAETAKAMRQVDPSVQLVACGSSNDRMPTFGSWEATILDHTFDYVDYISLHAYFEKAGEDRASFLASGLAMDRFIEGVVATADHVAAKKRSRRKLMLSFDEWNIWYESRFAGHTNLEWAQAPRLIEDEYTTEDAVVVGSLMMSLLRHADRVGVACLAQLVNIIAPIRAEPDRPAWRQTIFYPFALTARHARGEVLRVEPITSTYDTARHGDVPVADVVATHDAENGYVTIFAVNRSETETVLLEAALRALPGMRIIEHLVLGGVPGELLHSNSADAPERVAPRAGNGAAIDGSHLLTAPLPPASWTMLRLAHPIA
ncbi:alpha-N-arabinofuranosidase [Acrocarpospora pleiomorpha]|uniref:non-reducing end alpha-L-arabinofuranosidase n=1 Tax=Acrocarpospora pleiomorpha TaxID=90975 RepID=A0A5M3XTU5_9ACTN|nr:alpha-N-arabinofuranosidase [Acrocarpospora pleiomorpha]GES24675.1 alpha-N-arabinofuranosidase [Acrocarpospora pleiomorpha]